MKNVLKYKNFIATVKYSEEDEAFIGRIEGINSVVSFEGQSVAELKSSFKDAVESYLDFCNRKGIVNPQKSYTGVLNIRIPSEIHRKIALVAASTGVSINALIRDSIEKNLKYVQ
ncbi:MAG: type II toxin-antitoxin system HicB family antitoxin [Tannerellaceae bacterium]|jgi:predicted HicB family RNase H-like nuclease|nr:type II toxin-antitoxin system HicB family antitoxin [Tannerellaceae bacterium]